jgi:hypothetical protein
LTRGIENGFVHLPKDAKWLPEYLHELAVFPKGKHDDQVLPALRSGATAQILDWLKQSGREPGGMFQTVAGRARRHPAARRRSRAYPRNARRRRVEVASGSAGWPAAGRESPRRSNMRVPFSGDSGGWL